MIPVLVAVGVLALAWLGRRMARGRGRSVRITSATLLAGAGLIVALVVSAGLAAPFSPWDTVRIAPAMALLKGHPLYAGTGSGAVLSTMYGPIATLAFVPAAMVGDPALAAVLGRWLAFLFTFAPLVACCRLSAPAPGRSWRMTVLVVGTFGLLVAPSLRYSTTFLHADAPALGLLGLACLLAARPGGPGLGAAIACALAILTKQTMATLPPALIVAGWLVAGRAAALRFAAVLCLTGAAFVATTWWLVDRDDLLLNLVKIPGGVPWRGQAPGNLAATVAEMLVHGLPFLAALGVFGSCRTDDESARRAKVFAIAALALAPMAVLGRVKQAGDVNSFSPALYPLLLAVASRAAAVGPPLAIRRGTVAAMAVLIVFGSMRLAEEIRLLTKERAFDTESAFLKAHPGEVYFPWNPAAHVAVEGRPTHHLFSAWERGEAGFPVREAHLRSGLPRGCRYVAFPLKRLGPMVGFGSCVQMLERYDLLAKPATPVRLAGLPDYECYALTR
ncbi:MAG: hypothetical protein JWN86_4238 [Planctomycetota bacterium]|nr:hypothetical protein [Planctomycetota bacterium]